MLATLDQMRAWREVPAAPDDGPALVALAAADRWIKRQLGRNIELDDFTTRMSGDSSPLIYPANWPVQVVSCLVVDKVEWAVLASDAEEDADQEAFLDPSGLFIEARAGRVFTEGVGNIFLSYSGGYDPIPEDLVSLCVNVAHLLYLERTRIGDNQKTFGQVQVNEYLRGCETYPMFQATLQGYSRFGKAVATK